MAISRARKDELVAKYRQRLAKSNGIVFADCVGIKVAQIQDIRRKANEHNGQIFVVKNTLLNLVLKEAGLAVPEGLLSGPSVAVFCDQDVPPLAKLFCDFDKEMEEGQFVVKGGIMEGRFLSKEEVLAVANLPGRDELLSQVLRTINAPATQIVGVVASSVRQVLNVVQAYVDKLEEAGGSSAEAAA